MADLTHIASALQFSLSDLELNRVGKLSAGQTWSSVKDLLVATGLLLTSLAAIPAVLLMGHQVRTFVRVIAIVMGGVMGSLISVYFAWAALTAVRAHKPSVAEGPLQLPGGGRPMRARIGQFDGLLGIGGYDVWKAGERYRIYYLPGTKRFLSIEPTPSGPRSDGPK
ncbi:MAG TPA: hypothetical protein VHG72_02245 [Polyangia bacterium]|nr:hypothetical protein [Polyangia bacterium]